MIVVGIKDEKAQLISSVHVIENEAVAIREFNSAVNAVEVFRNFPEDYNLVKLGEFDPHSGITDCKCHVLAGAIQFVGDKDDKK